MTLRVCITTGQKKAVFSDDWFIEKVDGFEASSEWKDVETTIDEALESHGGSIKYERLVESHGNSLYTHHPDFPQDNLTDEPQNNKNETLKSMNRLKAFQKALNHVSFQDNPSNGKTAGRINGYTLDVVVRVKQKSNKRKNKSGADAGGIQLPNNINVSHGAG